LNLFMKISDARASHAHQGNIEDPRHYRGHGTSLEVNWAILAPIMAHGSIQSYNVGLICGRKL
jgi:hypothetical protein